MDLLETVERKKIALIGVFALISMLLIVLFYNEIAYLGEAYEGKYVVNPILNLELLAFATFAGFIGAIMGIGGGVIIVPTLSTVFNLPIHEAIAISIVSVVATSISGGSAYVDQRITNIRLAMFLETSTTLGALIGALLALIMPGKYLFIIFSAFALYMGFSQLYSVKGELRKMSAQGFKQIEPDFVSRQLNLSGNYFDEGENVNVEYVVSGSKLGWLASFLAGVGSGMLGIGGGFLKVSAMNILMNVPVKVAIATSKFMIGVTAATSAVVYYIHGAIRLDVVAPIAVGTALGATVGTRVMNKLKVKWLKATFSILTFYLAYAMLRKGLYLIFGIQLP